MFKLLSIAAVVALCSASGALAQEAPAKAEAQLEAAAEVFGARMEAFGSRAAVISEDKGLSEVERGMRMAALQAEYQPDIQAFAALASAVAPAIAAEAMAELSKLDLGAIVSDAMVEVQASGALAGAAGMATNGAWASNDPEHMATYGLVAEYAVGEAMDALEPLSAAPEAEAVVPAQTEAPQAAQVDPT